MSKSEANSCQTETVAPHTTKTQVRAFCLKVMNDPSVVMRHRVEVAGLLVQMLGSSWTRREVNRKSARDRIRRKKLGELEIGENKDNTTPIQRLSELTSNAAA